IDGQSIDVMVQADDDLGTQGIDRVVFFVNEVPFFTAFSSESTLTGAAAEDDIYHAVFTPPAGSKGLSIYAVAYGVLGQTGRSQRVGVGQIEDTVAPQVDVLTPADGEILTAAEAITEKVGVSDIGVVSARHVFMRVVREYRADVHACTEDADCDGTP